MKCDRCEKNVASGIIVSGHGKFCMPCYNEIFGKIEDTLTSSTPILQGWQCPYCRTVYGPHVNECKCQVLNYTYKYNFSGTYSIPEKQSWSYT